MGYLFLEQFRHTICSSKKRCTNNLNLQICVYKTNPLSWLGEEVGQWTRHDCPKSVAVRKSLLIEMRLLQVYTVVSQAELVTIFGCTPLLCPPQKFTPSLSMNHRKTTLILLQFLQLCQYHCFLKQACMFLQTLCRYRLIFSVELEKKIKLNAFLSYQKSLVVLLKFKKTPSV